MYQGVHHYMEQLLLSALVPKEIGILVRDSVNSGSFMHQTDYDSCKPNNAQLEVAGYFNGLVQRFVFNL